ncbi:MAG: fused MFS/spermidine synthase [Gallionella sp.]|nr:fused MFS/spermidine synthase [Gallionella sp.]MDD4959938.1 fused MFS/spermidine synthase [Gallionella sp.]
MSFSIDISESAGVRYLHFSAEWTQGAMRVARPWNLELEYTREMMVSLLLREDAPRKILLIGLGAASLLKFLYRNLPLAHLTVVEIEPRVVAAARQFFKLPEDPKRINLVLDDGANYVLNHDKQYDLILVDGFDENGRAGVLDTVPFYQTCRSRLSDNGVLAVNLLARSRGFENSVERMLTAFDDRAFVFPSCESGNAIAFAAAGGQITLDFEDLKDAAVKLKAIAGLNLLPTLTRLAEAKTCINNQLVL